MTAARRRRHRLQSFCFQNRATSCFICAAMKTEAPAYKRVVLKLSRTLTKIGVEARVQTAIEMKNVAEPFILGRAIRHLELGRVVIFAAGTGNPYFSTDTAAALRASEIGADVILKATKVDGVYDRDPNTDPNAKRFERITFTEALTKRLQVMDSTAFSLCMDNNVPIVVFDMNKPSNIRDAVLGRKVGTLVCGEAETT